MLWSLVAFIFVLDVLVMTSLDGYVKMLDGRAQVIAPEFRH